MMEWFIVWLVAALVLWVLASAMLLAGNPGGVIVSVLAGICLCASIVLFWDLDQLKNCEKDLPRTEKCVMVAVPLQELNGGSDE